MVEKFSLSSGSHIKNTIAIMSGKGGVGKSSVTALTATILKNQGYRVGILDADVTGPSIPKLFGLNKLGPQFEGSDIEPAVSSTGIKIMSVNLILENKDDPVVWRGPMISNTVAQFYTDVHWGSLDYLLIDLPPGTGDVPLTIMQSVNVDGLIVVSTPQDLVNLIVRKSTKMAEQFKIPIIGIIENMSYFICPNCNEKHFIYGKSDILEISKSSGIDFIGAIPIDSQLTELSDEGKIELYSQMNFSFCDSFTKDLNLSFEKWEAKKVIVPKEFNVL